MNDFLAGLLKFWPVLVIIGNIFFGWIFWTARKTFAGHSDVSRAVDEATRVERIMDARLDVMERDLAVVKTRVDTLPTKDGVHRLEVAIGGVAGDLKAVVAAVKAVERQNHLIMKASIGE